MPLFKAFIRVVKSLSGSKGYFDSVEVVKEPIIDATDKSEVKSILLSRYPQFFQKGKVYEKETRDNAQFFYVVIFPLYGWEIELINKGEWTCKHCGHIYPNRYENRPVVTQKPPFTGLEFCSYDGCYADYKVEYWKDFELPDEEIYIKPNSLNYIYKITEKSTGKCYIGKTRNEPFFRWWNHLKHSSSPFGIYLRNSNICDWTFEVLETLPSNLPDKEVFEIESKYIIQHNSIESGFNSVISSKTIHLTNNNQQ